MTTKFFFLIGVLVCLYSCNEEEASKNTFHPYAAYFYPADSVPKVYGYRDVAHGLDEQFKRIYTLEDVNGTHIVVETYVDRGRLQDVYVFDPDTLNVYDHVIVNSSNLKVQSELLKKDFFPKEKDEQTWFATRYPFRDSTFMLQEMKRIQATKNVVEDTVLGEVQEVLVTKDSLRYTLVNPVEKNEREAKLVQTSYFAKGIGLVRFHGPEKKADYQLEKIYSEEEWLKIVGK